MRPWIRSLSNPNTLTRMPPTQYPLSGKAAPPPNSRDAFPSLQQGSDPLGWAQGDPREPQGAQGYRRAPSAPLGGDGPTGPFGGDSEAISNGKPISSGRSFRSEGHSEWKVISNDPCELTYPMVPAGHGGEAPRAEGGRGGGNLSLFKNF